MKKNYIFLLFSIYLILCVHSAHGQCTTPPPAAATIAANTSVCLTESVVLSLSTAYNDSYTYQWQNSPNGGQFFDIAGATSATLTTTQAATRWYRATIRCNSAGQPTFSSTVQVTSTGEPCTGTACTTAPEDATVITGANSVCSGSAVVLSLDTEYTDGELFQWQYAGFNGLFINIAGATAAQYTATVSDNYVYRAVITCSAGNLSTETEAVAVNVANQAPALAETMPLFCSASTVANLAAALNPLAGTTIKWYATVAGGPALSLQTALTSGSTYYASQGLEACESSARTAVTVAFIENEMPDFINIAACGSYRLPELEMGAYYTGPAGTGTLIPDGTVIGVDTVVYVYVNTSECTFEESFTVDISDVPLPPTGATNQTMTSPAGVVAKISHIHVNGTNVQWYASVEDARAGINALDPSTPLIDGATYYATQTVGNCASRGIHAVTVTVVVLGTDDINAIQFTYYPNPVNDVLNISAQTEISSIKVYNLLGQEMLSKKVNAANVVIDMGSLTSGTYIVNVTANNSVKTFRVVKK